MLWQVEVALGSSKPTPQACREAGTTEQTYYGFNVRLRYAVFFDIAGLRSIQRLCSTRRRERRPMNPDYSLADWVSNRGTLTPSPRPIRGRLALLAQDPRLDLALGHQTGQVARRPRAARLDSHSRGRFHAEFARAEEEALLWES